MASPILRGTHAISAVSSRDMDVLNENLHIKIDRHFKTAFYQIEYTIRNQLEGTQIPLLFHARDYLGKFRVWVDGKPVELKKIPIEPQDTSVKFNSFSNSFKKNHGNQNKSILIDESYNSGRYFPLSDFLYFEISLKPGIHKINVEYTGKVWTNQNDWVNEYSFRYFLSPAKQWKSFHALNVVVDASAFIKKIHSNLGAPDSGDLQTHAYWRFSKIPSDYIQLSYQPPLNHSAEMLISVSPRGMTVIFGLMIFVFHVMLIRFTQKRQLNQLASFLVISGSLVLPFIILIGYGYSYDVIDHIIGSHAGRYHGYTFFSVFLYIILMPLYWGIMHRIRLYYKNRFAGGKSKT
ncbi:MAG: hypothetical protein K0S23_169 [Fluviicola sp.]|jgi:hypothetical protein|uniref:hypothetical protein n=1 Tax=Fluviicola sp. TaxID=1917219 RepID=UPI00261041E7|nr:hypothetical protein [Fluviicola sp.]MDF3025862.1 hypothetical protein [Fluviicola sp.]